MTNHLSETVSATQIEQKRSPLISRVLKHAHLPISVVIVSYNSRELLRACLASIESEQSGQVTVIDNVSSDGSDEMVAGDFPWVSLIKCKKNEGYGAAANLAIASCSSKYVLLLNGDTLLQPGSLQALNDYLDEHPQVAIVGPTLVKPDGTRQASWFPFPTPLQILLRETSLSKILPDNLSSDVPDVARAVPWVLGAALAIRRVAFESIGGFDRSFFMYYEEVDLCYRLKQSGWQIHFTPAAAVAHIGGASTKQQWMAMAIQLYKSLCHFYKKHYSRVQSFQLKLVLTYLMLRNIVKDALKSIHRTDLDELSHPTGDWRVWGSVLSGIWSMNGWLKH
jgi:GT2 family glycosyltransferase